MATIYHAIVQFVTPRAFLIKYGEEEEVWIPIRQCTVKGSIPIIEGNMITFDIPDWLARKKKN